MKKILIISLLALVSFAAFAEEDSLVIRPAAGVAVGSEDWFRGFVLGAHVQYNFLGTGIHIGAWTNVNYDLWYSNVSLPLALTIGFGKDFYLLAGTTIDLTEPKNPLTETVADPVGTLNTFGLGIHWELFPIGDLLRFGIVSELVYTNYVAESTGNALEDSLGGLVGILANIKVNAMASLEIGF